MVTSTREQASGMGSSTAWQKETNVSEKTTASILKVEETILFGRRQTHGPPKCWY
jgi:hypothetical protein